MNNQLLIGSDSIKCNALLIGKTGTGKSSLANYIFNTDIFSASAGKPVTNWENNFQWHSIDICNIKVNVFDSVGLEPDNFDNWKNKLLEFLKNKQANNSPNEHIHTLFYVVNAAGARIEDNEFEILRKIQSEFKLSTAIVLTNCDSATDDQIEKLENLVNEKNIKELKLVNVCSISKKTRAGKEIKPFGRDEALEILLSSSYEKVGRDLSIGVLDILIEELYKIKVNLIKKIEDSNISIFNIKNIESEMDNILESIGLNNLTDLDIEKFLPKKYNDYIKFLESFETNFQGKENINDIFQLIDSIDIESALNNNHSLMRKIQNVENSFNNDGIWNKITATFDIVGSVIRIKTTIKDAVNEAFYIIYNELNIVKNNISID